MIDRPLTVSVPTPELLAALSDLADTQVLVWAMDGTPPRTDLDLVVVPYMSPPSQLRWLDGVTTRLVQSQSIGYDGVAEQLPQGIRFANAAGVHEASTAELAVGLAIAAQRRLPAYARAQALGAWLHTGSRALADSRVIVIGQGGVGRATIARLRPFEVEIVRVAMTARTDAEGEVHGVDELPGLLPAADIVVLAVPLSDTTRGLVDRAFLALMKPQALLVNVARGPVVVTGDLVDAVAAGHVRAALDVADPEPLPPDHPLWRLDEVFLTPHIGGHSAAMVPRVVRLVRRQVAALHSGSAPYNVVLET
jgi:phosphoglycerate dehydrogenase-like enzyme